MATCCTLSKTKRLKARDLVDRVTIQAASDTHNGDGSITRTWSTAYTRWARIEATGGSEPDEFREAEGHCTYRVLLPYESGMAGAVTTRHRVTHVDGRILHIIRLYVDAPADRLVLVVNDYAPIIVADALTYDGTDYDAVLKNEGVNKPLVDYGERTRRDISALVRISDFTPGATALNETCTVYGKTYRISDLTRAHRGDWYRLNLVDQFGELPT